MSSAPTLATASPSFSVVVPAYGRPARLARCLAALAAQTLPADAFEVVICDDGSPEPLAPVAAPFAGRLRVRVLRQPNAGPAAARNAGAHAAHGTHLAFTDDDCMPAPEWLARLAARAAAAPDHLIGGAIENALPDDPFAAATQLLGDALVEHWERRRVAERLFSTSNLTVPAAAFRALGGFSVAFREAAGEDYDFCARWYHDGRPAVYAPEAVVQHAHGHTLASFWRQHFAYGRGLLRMRRRRAARRGTRVRAEAPGFYAHLVTYPLRRGAGVRGLGQSALVLLTQVATAAGAAREVLAGDGAAGEKP